MVWKDKYFPFLKKWIVWELASWDLTADTWVHRLATAPRRQACVTARCCWLQEEPKPLLLQTVSRDGNFSRECGLDGCTALQILSGGLTHESRWRCHCFWLMGPDVPPDFNFPLYPHHKSILHRVKARWVVLSRPGFPGFWCQRKVTVRQKITEVPFWGAKKLISRFTWMQIGMWNDGRVHSWLKIEFPTLDNYA